MHIGYLSVRPDAYRAELRGTVLPMTASQVALLRVLAANPDRVVTRAELAVAAGLEQERSVDVVLSSLRRVLGCEFVRNVRSRGWILQPQAFER